MSEHLMTTYAPASLAFERGEGAWLWDENGRRYLDAVAGIAVCSLGHAHPALARVIADQAGRLIHTANLVRIPWQERLADRLAGITDMERVFVANSGAEAVECAIKINRMLGHARGVELPSIIVMESSFHGRTLATLSASGSRKVQAGYEPLVAGFIRAPFDDLEAVRAIARDNPAVKFVFPESGATAWADTMVIPKGSQNIDAAAQWMNFVYDPVQAAQITAWVGYVSPVDGVREELEKNFRTVLRGGLSTLDLVTREEFEVQEAVLARTREKLEALEKAMTELEAGRKD